MQHERKFHTTALIRQASIPNADASVHSIEAIISSTRVDSGFLRMDRDTSLKNFVEALTKGTQLLCCHHISNGFGVSRDGQLVDELVDGNDVSLAVGIFDIERGLPLNPPATYTNSDAYIQRIENGKIKELSIGANGARFICDICGLDMMSDWSCIHYLGRRYMVEDEKGRHEVVATALVKDARLVEVSLVPRGANEDAVIIKKRLQVHVARGILSEADAQEVIDDLGLVGNVKGIPETASGYSLKGDIADIASFQLPEDANEEIFMSSATTEPRVQMSTIERKELEEWYEKREEQLEKDKAGLISQRDDLLQQIEKLRPLAEIGEDSLRTLRAETLEIFRSYVSLVMPQDSTGSAIAEKEAALKQCGYRELETLRASYQSLYDERRRLIADKAALVAEQEQEQAASSDESTQVGFRRNLQPVVTGGRQTLPNSAESTAKSPKERAEAYELRV